MEASKVRDALSSIQEIFLTSEINGEETLFSLGALTNRFVIDSAKSLNYYDVIKTRVDNFKNTFYADSPQLNSLMGKYDQAVGSLQSGYPGPIKGLLVSLQDEKSPKLTEDPRFLCLRAATSLHSDPGSLSIARADFQMAFDFNYCPPQDQLNLWFQAEKNGDSGDKMTGEILNRVQKGRGYDAPFKTRIKFDRACYLYERGRSSIGVEPLRAIDLLTESLKLHCESLQELISQDSFLISKSEEYARNTCFTLLNFIESSSDAEKAFPILREIIKLRRIAFDPVVEPLVWFMRRMLRVSWRRKEFLQRRFNKFETLVKEAVAAPVWSRKLARAGLESGFLQIKEQYQLALKEMGR